jgi:hypothetical protein
MDSVCTINFSEGKKWLIGLLVGVLFFLVSSPFMYKITGSITDKIGLKTSDNGCPNYQGVLLHTIVFIILLRLLMFIKF